jgi:phosphatidylserine/phosphatidylglycerophosphate/cardiolipin synthase-like enzyme
VSLEGTTTGGIFPSAYHIKVAVRDGSSVWLSSGNWQSSNQPEIEPAPGPAKGDDAHARFNREWHVVADHPGLAKLYEAYLDWDIAEAQPYQDGAEAVMTSELAAVDLHVLETEERPALEPEFFRPLVVANRRVRVQPILTPDNFAEHVLPLIKSANERLYLQNQYIKIAKENADEFLALVDAVNDKARAGLDVRVILRDIIGSRDMLEALKAYGFDMQRVRMQRNTHTKGIIVDSKAVLIGSHNWSNDGTLYNRDASLIFFDPEIARYFEKIFLHDWERLARRKILGERRPRREEDEELVPRTVSASEWAEFLDD